MEIVYLILAIAVIGLSLMLLFWFFSKNDRKSRAKKEVLEHKRKREVVYEGEYLAVIADEPDPKEVTRMPSTWKRIRYLLFGR